MRPNPVVATFMLACIALDGCSSLQEIPRAELADRPEQRDVSVEMRNGLHYDFDSARFGPDSLWGFKRTEDGGDIPEVSTTPLALDQIARVTTRRLDWYRTGLAAAGLLGGGIAVAVSQRKGSSSGGDGGTVKPPPSLVGGAKR